MDLSGSQWMQLATALGLGVMLFVAVYRLPEKVTIATLLLLLPLQLVDSRYGTSNTVMIYLVACSFMLQGRLRLAPLLIPVAILLFSYAISFSMSHPAARIHHLFYIVGFMTNFLLFYMIYNFVIRTGEWEFILKVLVFTNVVVLIICALELTLGQYDIRLFGLQEWAIKARRAGAGRLVGPFASTHTTADYLIAQCVILAFLIIYVSKKSAKMLLTLLIACNTLMLIATGDRGGFVGLVMGALLFVILFRREIGSLRAMWMLGVGIMLFSATSLIVVNYTDFGRLYERLEQTDVETGLAESRSRGFNNGMKYFQESPITGLGPHLGVSSKARQVADIPYRPSPHILVMHVLATVGIVGFVAWLIFSVAILLKLLSGARYRRKSDMLSQIPILGLLILALFMAGELRIDFLRRAMLDYQNYMFVLLGLFVAATELIRQDARRSRTSSNAIAEDENMIGQPEPLARETM